MTDEDFAAYAKVSGVNWSTLKMMGKSPKHYQHALKTTRADTAAMKLGRAVHTAVFEPDRFALEYAVFKGPRRAGKEWDAFADAHARETILKLDEYHRCIAIRDAVRSHPEAAKYLADGHGERIITWRDEESGVECKARYDWYSRSETALVDLKTSKDIEARAFARSAARLGYHAQLAMYLDGLMVAGGMQEQPEVLIIAVESDAPHDVAVYHLDADVLYNGREHYRSLLCRVAGCRELGRWPGRYQVRESLELPAWAYGEDDEGLTATVLEDEAA